MLFYSALVRPRAAAVSRFSRAYSISATRCATGAGAGVGGRGVRTNDDRGDDHDDDIDYDDDPLQTIRTASEALSSFSSRLRSLSAEIRKPLTLPSTGQVVSLKDIVLHSRDSNAEAFGAPAAVSARAAALPIAEAIEAEMWSMSDLYVADVAEAMAKATAFCRDAPCGGASWELEEEAMGLGGGASSATAVMKDVKKPKTLHRTRMETPCGRLHRSSVRFVELTHETREDIALGSRAACLLRMAREHGSPLAEVRKTEDGREAMGRVFAREKVPTPWVRSKEEYREFFRVRDETMADD